MELAFAVKGADFYAGENLYSESSPGVNCVRETIHDVVIGDRECRDSGFLSESENFGWGQAPIRVRGMEMEVNAAHGTALEVLIFLQRVGR